MLNFVGSNTHSPSQDLRSYTTHAQDKNGSQEEVLWDNKNMPSLLSSRDANVAVELDFYFCLRYKL